MGIPRQWTLFDGPPPKSHHAERLNPEAVICRTVLHEIVKRNATGAMVEEIADSTCLSIEQVSSALSELRLFGKVRKTEVKRITRAGSWRSVYVCIG